MIYLDRQICIDFTVCGPQCLDIAGQPVVLQNEIVLAHQMFLYLNAWAIVSLKTVQVESRRRQHYYEIQTHLIRRATIQKK